MKDKVSIILLNWNGLKFLEKCVESVLNQSYENIEFIIVDNGSTDRSIQIIQEKYPDFKYILNDNNLGFAKGMNQGIEVSSGKYILLLNVDVYLDSNYVKEGLSRIQKDEIIGFIGGLEYMWEDGKLTDKLHISCGPMYLRKRMQMTRKNNFYDEQFCFGITGSFPIVRRKMLDDIFSVSGYFFDEDFETGWEDTDMRFRAFLRGWKTLYYPKIHAWHVLSASDEGKYRLTQKNSKYQVRIFRNRYFVILKDLPVEIKRWLRVYLLLAEILMVPYYLFLYPRSFLSLISAKKQYINYKKSMIEKRKKIQKNILINLNELKKMFIEY
jgi:GT2 family glycosyltransferase